jgi:hypothetical protein
MDFSLTPAPEGRGSTNPQLEEKISLYNFLPLLFPQKIKLLTKNKKYSKVPQLKKSE